MPKIKKRATHTKLGTLSAVEKELRRDLMEFFYTHPDWPGAGHEDGEEEIKETQYRALPRHRDTIQVAGKTYGCHTCLTKIDADTNQPWTGDHNPPTKLTDSKKNKLFEDWDGKTTNLLAQCDTCSNRQASLVNKLNVVKDPVDYLDTLSEVEQRIIYGGREAEIVATGPKVTDPQGLAIQKEGIAEGCHSCGNRIPSHTYHADHLPPAELNTGYMPQVCEKLYMDEVQHFLDKPKLRPQCSRCSKAQGGNLGALAKRAQLYAKSVGIKVYK